MEGEVKLCVHPFLSPSILREALASRASQAVCARPR